MKTLLSKMIARVGRTLKSSARQSTDKSKRAEDPESQLPDLDKNMQQAMREPDYLPGTELAKAKLVSIESQPRPKWSAVVTDEPRHFVDVEVYLKAGGKVTELPPEPANPNRFSYTRLPKTSKKDKAVKLSEYPNVRVPKGEAMSSRLNMKSQDFTNVSHATGNKAPNSAEIHAALANTGMRESHEHFILFYFTEEERYRSGARAMLLGRILDDAVRQNWKIHKKGVMDQAATVALDNFIHPQEYMNLSDRAWAQLLGLSAHKHWPARWRQRYNALMQYGHTLLDDAMQTIARNV